MTNANAEAQRRWRQRQKEKRKESLKQAMTLQDVFKTPFFETVGDLSSSSDFADACELMGIVTPEFEDDRGPADFSNDAGAEEAGIFDGMTNSLARAELMVGCLIAAAIDLAGHVRSYKRSEIAARISEIEASDMIDPEQRKVLLKDLARLNKMLEQLEKSVRWTFPEWKVKDPESRPQPPIKLTFEH